MDESYGMRVMGWEWWGESNGVRVWNESDGMRLLRWKIFWSIWSLLNSIKWIEFYEENRVCIIFYF